MLKVTEKATEYLKSVTPEGDYVTLGVKGGGSQVKMARCKVE